MKLLYTVMTGAVLVTGLASGTALAEAPADPATVAAAKAEDPGKLIQTAAEGMLKDLEANRDSYRKDPNKLNALIEKYLLPNFDSQYSARLVLGKHWRDASEDQRKRFVDAFYHSLVKNYGSALVEFTSDRMKILPAQVDAKGETATVRTEIKRSNGATVAVSYSLRKNEAGVWKVWDVVIEGISYVKSYREDFGAEIDQKGLDSVIQRIEKGGTPSAPGKA